MLFGFGLCGRQLFGYAGCHKQNRGNILSTLSVDYFFVLCVGVVVFTAPQDCNFKTLLFGFRLFFFV